MDDQAMLLPYDAPYVRQDGEEFTEYWIRLFEHKDEYGIDCSFIASLLNAASGNNYNESTYRKRWTAFNDGRIYERTHGAGSVNIATRILCLSDLHVPFQLPVETFASYAGMVDVLVLNGDISDCQAISKFPKAYRISPMEELIATREYLIELIATIKPAQVVVTYGNHDVRFQNYLAKHLDTDILELMPSTSLELIFADGFHHYDKRRHTKVWYAPLKECLDGVQIEYMDSWCVQIGDTIFCHPMAFSSSMMNTAKKAMDYFRNNGSQFNALVMAHTHRVGSYVDGNTMLYEQGCCCDVRQMQYANGKLMTEQKEGFIYIAQDKDGHLLRDATRLVCLN